MDEKSLWQQFNLAEKNLDQGGGILYCLKYDSDRIHGHQEQVISALKDMGIGLEEVDEGIGVIPKKELGKSDRKRVLYLLEELSVLNEAQEYINVGLGTYNSISELKMGFISNYNELLENRNILNAFELVDGFIPQIVRDLKIADAQGKVLNSRDRKNIDELYSFSKSEAETLKRSGNIVYYG